MGKRERADRIEAMRRGGATLQAIGEAVGITRERVRQICRELGIVPDPKVKVRKRPSARPSRLPQSVHEARAFASERSLPDPYRRFLQNRHSAKQRGIHWALTFDEWWGLWKQHYHLRGKTSGAWHLCRYLDSGGYIIGNVRVDRRIANDQERSVVYKSKRSRAGKSARGARSWAGLPVVGVKTPHGALMDKQEGIDVE